MYEACEMNQKKMGFLACKQQIDSKAYHKVWKLMDVKQSAW
jgi:hypothetical protein